MSDLIFFIMSRSPEEVTLVSGLLWLASFWLITRGIS